VREPVACVLLALDPAATSGWGLFLRGKAVDRGLAKNAKERRAVVDQAQQLAEQESLPLVVVAEGWSAGGWKSVKQLLGMGASWGRWAEQFEIAGVSRSRIVRVLTQDWRMVVLGGGGKAAALTYAERRWPLLGAGVTDDVAEALCVGDWGLRAGEVAAVARRTR